MTADRFARAALELALFQSAWWLTVTAAARGWGATAALPIAVYLALLFVRSPPDLRPRLASVTAALALAGLAIDSLQSGLGLLRFAHHDTTWLAPIWDAALWAQLAATLPMLAPLARRPWLGALLGATGGPLAFLGGARIGAVAFPDGPLPALATLALVWAMVVPLLAWLGARSAHAAELDPAPPVVTASPEISR